MQSVTTADKLDFDELYILSGLLQLPTKVAREFVLDLRETWGWVDDAARELESRSLEDWQQEYLALFLRRGGPSSCPPYESDYCGSDRPGSSAERMAELHMVAEVQLSNMPPDFLGSELRLLAQLLDRDGDDLDPALIDKVLGRLRGWVPRFARDLQARSSMALYRALGRRLEELFG